MVRASVNLTVASILISLATSMKLPLSTTYVTFMVAMGTSLADKAWGRDSAVYRISGVVTVIGGWFMTAITAFTVAFIIAFFISWGGVIAIIIFVFLAFFVVLRTHIFFNKKAEKEKSEKKLDDEEIQADNIIEQCSLEVQNMLKSVVSVFSETVVGLTHEDRKLLKNVCKEVDKLNIDAKNLKTNVHNTLLKLQEEEGETGHFYVQVIDYLREMAHSLTFISHPSYEHIDNNHKPLLQVQIDELNAIKDSGTELFEDIIIAINKNEFGNIPNIIEKQQIILDSLRDGRKKQIKRIKDDEAGTRNSILYLGILNEVKNFLLHSINLIKAQRDFIDFQLNNNH
jgi:Na+/phosphate symporter